MKRRLLALLLICVMCVVALSACGKDKGTAPVADNTGSETKTEDNKAEDTKPVDTAPAVSEDTKEEPVQEAVDYEAIYKPVIDRAYDIISNSIPEDSEPAEGENGLFELRSAAQLYQHGEQIACTGYAIKDLTGDGVPELIIGDISDYENDVYYGCMIYALYTVVDGAPSLTFEGWSRNTYDLMNGNKILNIGSAGAAYAICAVQELSTDATKANFLDFYFTYETDDTYETIGLYHNTTGVYDREAADLIEGDIWDFEEGFMNDRQFIDFNSFGEYGDTYVPYPAPVATNSYVTADFAGDEDDNYTYVECDTSDYKVPIILKAVGEVSNVKVYRLDDLNIDDNGNLSFDWVELYNQPTLPEGTPLVFTAAFPGDFPSYAFSYVDSNGMEWKVGLSISGKDGSLYTDIF